jgi:hypothetical protein
MLIFWADGLDPFREVAAFEQDTVPAALALDADVRTEPDHFPLSAPARMRLPQLYDITERQIGKHAGIIPTDDDILLISAW